MIFTRYIKSEDKICVQIDKKQIYVSLDPNLGHFENHVKAAKTMAKITGWNLLAYGDCQDGYAFVNANLAFPV